MHVPPDGWNIIYRGAYDALSHILDSNGDLFCGASVLYAADVLSIARTAVDAALSDVIQCWNTAHRDPIISLPFELACQCFRLLEFDDRLAVSHVSRAWRASALADPWLWNEAAVSWRHGSGGIDKVSALLERSDPLPFSFWWVRSHEEPVMPHDLFDIIQKNMHRMEYLSMDRGNYQNLQELFRSAAPNLRTLVFWHTGRYCVLPHNWGGDRAPFIEEVCVGYFTFPATFRPLASVKSFSGSWVGLYEDWQVPVNLFSYFPALHTLHLEDVTQDALEDLHGPPASLRRVTLGRAEGCTVDYAPLFSSWRDSGIKYLRLRKAVEFSSTLPFFTSVVTGEWHLRFDWRGVVLRADSGDEEFTINTYVVHLPHDSGFTAHLTRLRSISLSSDLLDELWSLKAWNRKLPCLSEICIHFSPRIKPDVPLHDAPPIHAPLLDPVRLAIQDSQSQPVSVWPDWIREEFPQFLPRLFVLGRPRLASVVIEAGKNVSPNEDFASLKDIAEEVRVRTGMKNPGS